MLDEMTGLTSVEAWLSNGNDWTIILSGEAPLTKYRVLKMKLLLLEKLCERDCPVDGWKLKVKNSQ